LNSFNPGQGTHQWVTELFRQSIKCQQVTFFDQSYFILREKRQITSKLCDCDRDKLVLFFEAIKDLDFLERLHFFVEP
jgi:hypothetical protein